MQRGTLGPEADETSSLTVTLPQRARVSLSKQRERRAARSTCAAVRMHPTCAQLVTKRQHGEQVQEHVCRRALHSRADGLGTADHSVTEEAVNARLYDRVLRRCHAAPRRCGTASELSSCDASSAQPVSQPRSRLIVPVHGGSRVVDRG